MPKNQNLHKAKKEKNDEFYTQLIDIERELQHYTTHLNGKTIYCNCDSPNSQFVHYFKENFHTLQLKKLIATSFNPNGQGTYLEYDGKETLMENLIGSGDFRSVECSNLLKEADIVITNPPFSLFREYVEQLIKFDKKFIIVGSVNAITYKEIFRLIKDNCLWLGYGFKAGNAFFKTPNWQDYGETVYNKETGLVKFRNVTWYTNLDISKRHEELVLFKSYHPNEYPKYDNYDAINVNKTKDIPKDYKGHIGVPITFLDKYNPNQFEIVRFRKGNDNKDLKVNGKCPYFRIIIKHKKLT